MRITKLKVSRPDLTLRVAEILAAGIVGAIFLSGSLAHAQAEAGSALVAHSQPESVAHESTQDESNEASPPANTPAIALVTETATETASTKTASSKTAPTDEALPGSDSLADAASLIPDLPPVPRANATLVGGTIEKLDRVRDQITVSVFGGGRMKVLFDPRTHIFKSGVEASFADLHTGDRIYLDTILDGTTVFARNIRVKTAATLGESRGVVVSYRAERGELTVRDAISPKPMVVRVTSSTKVTQDGRAVPASLLITGALVALTFDARGGGKDAAREISVLALPGADFTFAGQVVSLDLRTGLLVLKSSTDGKTYEIYLAPNTIPEDSLQAGALVTVLTRYDGAKYVAGKVAVSELGK